MDLELTRYFVRVVQNGSFSRAAQLMQVPKSTVSKSIARLESETGTKLLLRTTRSLTLTEAGRSFYDIAVGPIQALEDAYKSLHGKDRILSGVVKITAPEEFGSHILAPAIAELSAKHQDLRFDLVYTDEVRDLIQDGFDLAFRIGKLNQSNFKIKRLGNASLVLVAAPEYLKNTAKIKTPSDLEQHACISFRDLAMNSRWRLKSKKETVRIAIKPRIASNQMTSLVNMAIAGGGVALAPNYLCRPEIAAGRLVAVLPGWSDSGFPVSMVTPLSVSSSARLKITADRLAEMVQRALRF
jgi:LysR family transcriptional regulator for bpeEF and oprC